MPATLPVGSSVSATLLQSATVRFTQEFPDFKPQLEQLLLSRFSVEQNETKPRALHLTSSLSPEEIVSIFEKINQISQLPGLLVDAETELYLEQQLEDMLGFGISTKIESFQLPFVKGVAESLAHLYAIPGMQTASLQSVPEAGLSTHRSTFGWQLQTNSSNKTLSPYWISLPLRSLSATSDAFNAIKKSLLRRKVVLINPSEGLCAVAEIMDDYTDSSHKYQFGISPAVSREGLFWSPQNLGKSLIFFITDSQDAPQVGIYPLL